MLFRVPKTRRFHYYPLFYREEEDRESGSSGRRIHFRRSYRLRTKRKSFVGLILLLILIIFFIEYLHRFRTQPPKEIELKNMEIVK